MRHLDPIALLRNLWRHRNLIRQFARREVEGRYKGSSLGLMWSFLSPLILLLIYTFAFGVVFKVRWPQAGGSDHLAEFALALFCGLIVLNTFGECVNRAPGLIVSVPHYVKKVVFPLEVLPLSVLASAVFHGLLSVSVLVVANVLISDRASWTLIGLPLVALPLVFLILGLSWLLASLGVFLRDLNYLVVLTMQLLPFVTPIFYPLAAIPEPFRQVIALNPLTPIVESFRRIVLWGILPDWGDLLVSLFVTVSIMLVGYAWFMTTKRAFADVI